ncbi:MULTISPECIES: CO2 hydration protein [unclassified Synechococcus]|uniref:CO2 hydration protein n=1 Tax=unclassified Synechococcus TaxID=2626047 RepID=UPI0021A2EEDB|nr:MULTISPECIES: CO2 hydration protein [unclassified Synechococcus]MCT0213071.1 CO2 hydration protein [Synechococcus sp. CS-1326]MCT0232316.1 CO2 hydration protein [Synechococcus sp. CS-1327]
MSPPSAEQLMARLLSGQPLLEESADHLLEVVGVLESYGEVLDAYSINLNHQAQREFLNPLPIWRFFDGALSAGRLWRHLIHDRLNYEYAEYCQRMMLWHGTGGLDTYLDSNPFAADCRLVIAHRRRRDPLLNLLDRFFPDFLPELIRSAATASALGQFWRVMSDLFRELRVAHRHGRVDSITAVVAFLRDGLVAAAGQPIHYRVELDGKGFDILPAEAGLTFLADVAVPYVEAVFLRGTPFLGTVSFNAQAQQIPIDQGRFQYGALFADPLPTMGAGIPPSLLMQDMSRHLPADLEALYASRGRGRGDLRVKICTSFQKAMFCVTNAAIAGTFPHPLRGAGAAEQGLNHAHAEAWVKRLLQAQIGCLPAAGPVLASVSPGLSCRDGSALDQTAAP